MQIDPFLSPCTKLKLTWIKDQIKPDKPYLIEEEVGKSLEHMSTGETFLNRTPMVHTLRSQSTNGPLQSLKSFYKAKDTGSWLQDAREIKQTEPGMYT